jgi:hypothetical protein
VLAQAKHRASDAEAVVVAVIASYFTATSFDLLSDSFIFSAFDLHRSTNACASAEESKPRTRQPRTPLTFGCCFFFSMYRNEQLLRDARHAHRERLGIVLSRKL